MKPIHRTSLLALITAVAFVSSCGDSGPETSIIDTTIRPDPAPTALGERDPATIENFESVVRQQYAREALALPRREMDSILAAHATADPASIQRAMEKRLKEQDAVARRNLAARYGISLDSLNAILSQK